MNIGVVSDTHNNLNNIKKIIALFNEKKVDLVIHTGDISNAKTLENFSSLNSKLIGVYGNNDRNEIGLDEICNKYSFDFQEPPNFIKIENRNIAIFHEPEKIDETLKENPSIDIVLHGHTHRYRNENSNGVLIFNPGESAGLQKGSNAIGILNTRSLKAKRIFF
tara:strand:- start:339 stop:830 length:492 start_codon:yes stop_codon:yes gene_type:complete